MLTISRANNSIELFPLHDKQVERIIIRNCLEIVVQGNKTVSILIRSRKKTIRKMINNPPVLPNNQQSKLGVESYIGLADAIRLRSENESLKIGRMVIPPPTSFIG